MDAFSKHVRVEIDDLSSERLDTGFYTASYFAAREALGQSGLKVMPIGAMCEPWSFGAYALTNEIEWVIEDAGVPAVVASIDFMGIKRSQVFFLDIYRFLNRKRANTDGNDRTS